MKVELASDDDLKTILAWLKEEHDEYGTGFWCNRSVVQSSKFDGDLWVIRQNDKAVAFQAGDYLSGIVCVQKYFQKQGFGKKLFEATLARAERNNIAVLCGECVPQTSLPFWEKLGFERYGDMSAAGRLTVRRFIERNFSLPANCKATIVTIEFYDDKVLYERNVLPISSHQVIGGYLESGKIQLKHRVIGLKDDYSRGGDLVVKILMEDAQICFCKAKYDEAQKVGIQKDNNGDFFIDIINIFNV